jgi:hypothetical protein
MVAVSVYCIGRLVAARLWDRPNHADVNVSHMLMGAAMAGMLVPAHNPISNDFGEGIFGFLVLWFLFRSVQFVSLHGLSGHDEDGAHHLSHYTIHMLMAGAMTYMYALGMPITTSVTQPAVMMSQAGGAAGYGALSLLFIVLLFGSAIWQLDSISRFAPAGAGLATAAAGGGGSPPMLAPRLEVACHIAMCITMGYMLVIML